MKFDTVPRGKASFLSVLHALVLCCLGTPVLAGVGGGFTAGGIQGQYFNNTTLTGSPAFTRQDVRINFNWGTTLPPGGSSQIGFSAIGTTNYSVQWTGQLIPRFSETYTFKTISASGVILMIKPHTSGTWSTIISDWTGHAQTTDSATFSLTAGTLYDIEMQYYQSTGSAIAVLHWLSPSTPEETIDALGNQAHNLDEYRAFIFADRMKYARDQWLDSSFNNPISRDSNGWPTQDGTCMVWEGVSNNDGTYLLQFNGEATVTCPFTNYGSFTVGSTNYGTTLPSGAGYNSGTNTTTAVMKITDTGLENFIIGFSNSQRTSTSATNTGVTFVKLMRPTSEGATTYYDPSLIFTTPTEAAYGPFTAFRWLGANFNIETNWSDRTTPAYSTFEQARMGTNGAEDIPWEFLTRFANETGKDLWITIPEQATGAAGTDTTSYIYQLAQLIMNGDTVNGVAYYGLNPNLRLYFEYSNEVWNFGFPAWGENFNASNNDVATHDSNGQIITFDGDTDENIDWNRRQALRTVQSSNIFRTVWGNANMPGTGFEPRVRPCLETQYDNAGWPPVTSTQVEFLDDYFNNQTGNYVATPEPLSYYLWGEGGATYYDGANDVGTLTSIAPANNSFESGTSGWTFTGNSGVVANGSSKGNPNAPDGTNAAYIGDTGSISQSVNFTSTGVFCVTVQIAGGSTVDPIDFYLDGTRITPYGGDVDYLQVASSPQTPNGGSYTKYSSFEFTLSATGSHTIKFVGTGASGTLSFLDLVQIGSEDGLFGADIPASTINNGTVISLANLIIRTDTEVNWAKRYGLHETSYEGGWGLGGDNGGYPIQNYAKYADSRAATAQVAFDNVLNQSGVDMQFYGTYASWYPSLAGMASPATYPLYQGMQTSNANLPAEATNGVTEPGTTLVDSNQTLSLNDTSGTINNFGWIDWNIIVSASGNDTVSTTTGTGGNVRLSVDDTALTVTGASGGTLSGTVFLTKGLHTVQVVATSGTFAVTNASVAGSGGSAPSAPTGLTATAGNTQAALSWNASSGATSYNVQRSTVSGSGYATVTTGDATTTYTNTGLTNGTTYYFVVQAVNSFGTSGNSNQASAVPASGGSIPPAPTGLMATGGNAQVALTWNASSGATGYNVQRGTVSGSGYATIGSTSTNSYSDSSVTNGTTYYYVVQAVNSFGTSGSSNQASATPSGGGGGGALMAYEPFAEATGALNDASGGSGFGAAWTTQNNDTTVPGYNVLGANPLTYTGLSTSGNYGVGGNAYLTAYRPLDVTAGGNFGSNGYVSGGQIGVSGKSLWISALVRKDANNTDPNYIDVYTSNFNSPLIAFGYISGSPYYWGMQVNGTTYQTTTPITIGTDALLVLEIQFGSTNTVSLFVNPTSLGGSPPGSANASTTTGSSLAFSNLAYYGGNGSGESSIDEIRFGTTFAAVTPTSGGSAPPAPTGLTAAAGNSQVALSWNASTGATSYNVQRSTVSGSGYATVTTGVTTTAYTNTGLTNGTAYYFVVQAVNSVGTSGSSNQASATPEPAAPAAPTGLTATPGNAQVFLSWTASSGATSYNVQRSTVSGSGYATVVTGNASTAYTNTGLTNGTTYYFVVQAVNGGGTSGNSNQASTTPQVSAPAAPTGLTATPGSAQVALSWTASSGATSYNVQRSTVSGSGYATVVTGNASTAYTNTGLTNGTTYYFVVQAVNSGGTSGNSNQASATPSSGSGGTLMAVEEFTESTGALNGANGGSGFSGAWQEQNGRTDIPGYNIINTSPLTYSGLATSGNYAVGGEDYESSGRAFNVSTGGPFNSYLSGGAIGASGTTLWMSALIRKDANNEDPNYLLFLTGSTVWYLNSPLVGVGYFGSGSDNGGTRYWSLEVGSTVYRTTIPATVGATALVVVEITFGSTNTVNLYVNPSSLGGSAPGTASATATTTSSVAFQDLAYMGGYGAGDSSVDEIRVGTTYGIVTP